LEKKAILEVFILSNLTYHNDELKRGKKQGSFKELDNNQELFSQLDSTLL
jgi:hypothetical protein